MAISRNVLFYQEANGVIYSSLSDANGDAVDLTGYTIDAVARKHSESSNSYAFGTAAYANGLIVCSMTGLETANMESGRYVYNINVTENSSNTKIRIQHGLLIIKPNV